MDNIHQFFRLPVSWPCTLGTIDKVWYHLAVVHQRVDGGAEQQQQRDDFYQQW